MQQRPRHVEADRVPTLGRGWGGDPRQWKDSLRDPDTSPPRAPLLPCPALPTLPAGSGFASAAATLRCPWSRQGGRCRSQPCGGSSVAAPAGPGLRRRLSRSRQAGRAGKGWVAGRAVGGGGGGCGGGGGAGGVGEAGPLWLTVGAQQICVELRGSKATWGAEPRGQGVGVQPFGGAELGQMAPSLRRG